MTANMTSCMSSTTRWTGIDVGRIDLSGKRVEHVGVTSGAGSRGWGHIPRSMHTSISSVSTRGLSMQVGMLLDRRWRRVVLSKLLNRHSEGLWWHHILLWLEL